MHEEFLNEMIDISEEILKNYFLKSNYKIAQKSDHTFVTSADQETEQALRNHIKKYFPHHGILGEEYGEENKDATYKWVLDPIDGTIAFLHGVPLFVTLIALLKDNRPILGAINQPIAQLRCYGDNENTYLNNKKVKIRNIKDLSKATLLATDIVKIRKLHTAYGLNDLIERVNLFRTWGDGFGYLMLASGKADIMLDAKMAPWDLLPVIPVVRGAGAKITCFQGKDAASNGSAICAPANMHQEVMNILHSAEHHQYK